MNDSYLPMTLDYMLAQDPGRARRQAARAWYDELQEVFTKPERKGGADNAG